MVGEQLIQQDGQRVRFGSGGAPGAPAPKPEEASRSSGCNKGRKDLLLERVNARAVPEKVRLSNREGAGEPTPLRALIRKGRKPGQVLLRRSAINARACTCTSSDIFILLSLRAPRSIAVLRPAREKYPDRGSTGRHLKAPRFQPQSRFQGAPRPVM